MSQEWTTGCCSCFSDIPSCLLVCLLGPCITYGMTVNAFNQSGFCGPCLTYFCMFYMLGCPCFVAAGNRTAIRNKYGLKEGPLGDCLMHFPCCTCCAVCQEYREVTNRAGKPNQVQGQL